MWQNAAIGLVFLQNNFDYIMSCVKIESINRNLSDVPIIQKAIADKITIAFCNLLNIVILNMFMPPTANRL